MGVKRKTITITDRHDNWIKWQVRAGRFANDSEYIRDLIRRDQESQGSPEDIQALRAALIEGIESGDPQPFDVEEFIKEMHKKYGDKTT